MDSNRWLFAQSYEKNFWINNWKKQTIPDSRVKDLWWRYIDYARNYIAMKNDSKVLDIGCGPNGMINYIDEVERFGLDPLMDYYIANFNMPEGVWKKGTGEKNPFEDNFFDAILTTNTIDHTQNPTIFLKEINRVLKKNYKLFLTVNCYSPPIVLVKKLGEIIGSGDPYHPHSFTKRQIVEILERSGFKLVDYRKGSGGIGAEAHKNRNIYEIFMRAYEIFKQDKIYFLIKTSIFVLSKFQQNVDYCFIAKKI